MPDFDVFNGDADGICALHQLRLAEPRKAELITGVKRDIGLLSRISSGVAPGDRIAVFDISVEPNLGALDQALARGADVTWFDHHYPGALPVHEFFRPVIETTPGVCTSLLVNRHLAGRFRPWAIVGLFGDGLQSVAMQMANDSGFDDSRTEVLSRLGEAINYNSYGETAQDLHVHPAVLYRCIASYEDPLEFARREAIAGELNHLLARDLEQIDQVSPICCSDGAIGFVLPATAWARRVSGNFANRVSSQYPDRAVAVLTPLTSGSYQASIRAPRNRPFGADQFCRRFSTGGGRAGAGGVSALPAENVPAFLGDFMSHFSSVLSIDQLTHGSNG
jgi:hypothetical protein